MKQSVAFSRRFKVEIHDPLGRLIHEEEFTNLTTNEGLDEILDKFWKGSSYSAAHYVGLTDGTPTFNAADTMASHAGWAEEDGYDESTREALTLGSVSSQSVDNSASKAVFTITSNGTTVGGAFVTTNSTKGGTSGILIGGQAFSGGDQVLSAGSTISITVTNTVASA